MKKVYILVALMCATLTTYAQSIADGLRLGTTDITGTARFRALGGAFGALGGDLSAIGINPASSVIFTRGTTSFTLAVDSYNSDVNYFGTTNNTSDVAFNYDRSANLDDQFFASGIGNTSIASYFSEFAQGVPLDLLQLQDGESIASLYQFLGEQEGFAAQQAFLGFQSFIIDPEDFDNPNNIAYTPTIAGNSFDQRYSFISEGYNSKASFNIGAQYDERLSFGLNLNSHFADYTQSTELVEFNDNDGRRVPGRYTGSLAYLFGKNGLISFDYSYSDFSNLTFRPTNDPFFQDLNQEIENTLKGKEIIQLL